jgi:hypothetical protein
MALMTRGGAMRDAAAPEIDIIEAQPGSLGHPNAGVVTDGLYDAKFRSAGFHEHPGTGRACSETYEWAGGPPLDIATHPFIEEHAKFRQPQVSTTLTIAPGLPRENERRINHARAVDGCLPDPGKGYLDYSLGSDRYGTTYNTTMNRCAAHVHAACHPSRPPHGGGCLPRTHAAVRQAIRSRLPHLTSLA